MAAASSANDGISADRTNIKEVKRKILKKTNIKKDMYPILFETL